MCMKDGSSGKVLWQQNSDFSKSNIEHEARIPKKILKYHVKQNTFFIKKHFVFRKKNASRRSGSDLELEQIC